MLEFERQVADLAALFLQGSPVPDLDKYDEQTLFEALHQALCKGGLARLDGIADTAIRICQDRSFSGELFFELFSEAVDMATVEECSETVWRTLEERAVSWRPFTLSTQQRPKLALLKVANELLRRISPTAEPVLCGRVLMLLAAALPLSDNSGFNMAGKYNLENETPIESFSHFTENGNNSKDYTAYERFWKLQKFFSGPFVIQYLSELKTCLESTFQIFESKPMLNDSRNANDLEYIPKYLTDGRLISLQWTDPKIRRSVMVQLLFFARQVALYAETTGNMDLSNMAAQYRERAARLLRKIPPNGPEFTDAINQAVDREEVWESWKKEKCPPIEQPLPQKQEIVLPDAYSKRSKQLLDKQVKTPRWLMASRETSWGEMIMGEEEYSNRVTDADEQNDYIPPPADENLRLVATRMADAFSFPDYDFTLYDPRKDFIYCWQGMRLTRSARLDLFTRHRTFAQVAQDLNGLPIDEEPEIILPEEPTPTPASRAPTPSGSGAPQEIERSQSQSTSQTNSSVETSQEKEDTPAPPEDEEVNSLRAIANETPSLFTTEQSFIPSPPLSMLSRVESIQVSEASADDDIIVGESGEEPVSETNKRTKIDETEG